MSNDASFVGSIPEFYDKGLGPIIFADQAVEMAKRVEAHDPKRVLETAAGTGIVTRELRNRLSSDALLTATDLNAPMLDVARVKFRPGEKVEFQPADALALPFPDAKFDAVVCQFGAMFYPDKDKSFREVHRVLVPGGRYFFSVWDSHKHNPFGRITHKVMEDFFPADPPQFMKVPFSYPFDPIKDSLTAAGFGEIHASVVKIIKEIPDPENFARGAVYGNPLIDQIKAKGEVDPEKILEALLKEFRREFGSDPARMPQQSIMFSARKPL
jgi:ubiquinone/menaquinone biosynthesis C-methylase UbiE